jgi:hypothetical protein
MTALLQLAAYALGTYLSIRMIAALHGLVDVWCVIDKTWRRVFADVVLWGVMTGVIAWLLNEPYRAALSWGVSTYLIFYRSLLPLIGLYVSRRRTDRDID